MHFLHRSTYSLLFSLSPGCYQSPIFQSSQTQSLYSVYLCTMICNRQVADYTSGLLVSALFLVLTSQTSTRHNSRTSLVAGEISSFLFTSLVGGKDEFPVFITYRARCPVSRICLVKGETCRSSYFLRLNPHLAENTVCLDHRGRVHKFVR